MRNELGFYDGFDLIDSFFRDDDFFGFEKARREEVVPFRCDCIENENSYDLMLDVPGMKKEDISLSYEDGYLTIEAEHKNKDDFKNKHFVRKERYYSVYKRTFNVGNICENEIEAKLDSGVLTVTIPKEKKKIITKKQIEIK